MIHVYVKGIPHWTDGRVTLPVMAGGDFTFPGGGTSTTSSTGRSSSRSNRRPGTIRTFADLKAWNKDYKNFTLVDLLTQLSNDGYTVAPDFYKQFQDFMLQAEAEGIAPVADLSQMTGLIPAAEQYYGNEVKNAANGGRTGAGGGGGGGGGTAARDYAAEQAAQHQYDLELANLNFQHQEQLAAEQAQRDAEAARLAQENQMRRDKLSEAGALTRTLVDAKQRTRQIIAELTGVDPVAASVAQVGGVQRGTTPAQSFMTQNKAFANAPVPQINENASLPELQTLVDSLNNQQQAPVAPALGFAGGGSFDPRAAFARFFLNPRYQNFSRLRGGARAALGFDQGGSLDAMQGMPGGQTVSTGGGGAPQFGTDKQAVLVGEAGSQIAPGTEVMIHDNTTGTDEIIPLSTQGMATGGSFDPMSIQQGLAPIYGALGFSGNGPGTNVGDHGYSFQSVYGSGDIAHRLGYSPRLLRAHDTGQAYFRNAAGQLQAINSEDIFNQSGFKWPDFFNVSSGELGQFGTMGPALTAPPPLIEQPQDRTQPLLSPPETGSIPLPNLPQLAQALAGMRRYLDPNIWSLLSSIYGRAGLGLPQNALESIQQAVRRVTPTGTGNRAGARLG